MYHLSRFLCLLFLVCSFLSVYSEKFGRISPETYVLTPEQIDNFRKDGCCTLDNVLSEEEVDEIEKTFDQFLNKEIFVPGKDFCDMSKPFDTPFEEWSIVNCSEFLYRNSFLLLTSAIKWINAFQFLTSL